jgi:integrase/recombinase XerD
MNYYNFYYVKRKGLMEIQNPLDIALKKINKPDYNNQKLVLSGNI